MSEEDKKSGTVYVISDSTGETAMTMTRAALVQFSNCDAKIIRCKNIRTDAQVESLIEQAMQNKGILIYTVASKLLRKKIREVASEKGIQAVDLLSPILDELNTYFGESSKNEHGLLRVVDDKYFKRIEAIEYTVKHDDGKLLTDLDNADIVLVGISRTSKTPLSIFLSHKGWKVANIPLVLGSPLPKELFEIDQRKIVGLVIDESSLQRIRKNRLERFGQDPGGEYARMSHIHDELDFATNLFKKNRRWPVLNVTEQALEETAGEITKIVATRLGLKNDILF